ncbi:MAG: hypothetical protein EKK48_12275 [Candidatus Melainabacteria bacterium]|nr:MAG: hypothetical protein EKK48_12275 [Candidatus Melainabacteria bacterium]
MANEKTAEKAKVEVQIMFTLATPDMVRPAMSVVAFEPEVAATLLANGQARTLAAMKEEEEARKAAAAARREAAQG